MTQRPIDVLIEIFTFIIDNLAILSLYKDVAKRIGDDSFIIPLKLEPFDAPFVIAQAQRIAFDNGWSTGLAELTEALRDYGVANAGSSTADQKVVTA